MASTHILLESLAVYKCSYEGDISDVSKRKVYGNHETGNPAASRTNQPFLNVGNGYIKTN